MSGGALPVAMTPVEVKRRRRRARLPDGGGLHPVLRRVYERRGVGDPDELDLSLKRLLSWSSPGMREAVALLCAARRAQTRISIVGDYDTDGATSVALLARALRGLGYAHVAWATPDRFRFGYGLTPAIVEAEVAARKPELIVTVDNGIASTAGVERARALGVKVIITDHHLPGASLPAADAIVNPSLDPALAGDAVALAGVGVVFYLCAALRRGLADDGFAADLRLADFLDLVALGTVADVVPLTRNNRVLVRQGLERIRAGRCSPGVRALFAAAGRDPARATAADLGFGVAPRINAAGRLENMGEGIACLLADDRDDAMRRAARLNEINRRRRELSADMERAVFARAAAARRAPAAFCLYDSAWHQGVIGIAAARLKDWHGRPAIVFANGDDGALRGSARSVEGVHIRKLLGELDAANPGLLGGYGGHAMAAGLSLPPAHFDRFAKLFVAAVAEVADADMLQPRLESDGALAADELNYDTALALREGGPWGKAFPEPLFDGEFAVENIRPLADGRHLRLALRAPANGGEGGEEGGEANGGKLLHAVAFNVEAFGLPAQFDRARLVYSLEADEWMGAPRLQLIARHVSAL